MKKNRFFCWILFLGLTVLPVLGQEKPSEKAAPAGASAGTVPQTSERKAFDEKLTEYKGYLKTLRSLKAEYQTATPQQKDKIIEQFNPLVNKTDKIQKDLVPLALSAWKVSKGEDPELAQFLFAMLQWITVAKEDYETAYSIGKVLCESPLPAGLEVLYAFAAYAAFNVMELDDAEKWFKVADAAGAVEKADPKNEIRIRVMLQNALPMYKKFWPEEKALREKQSKEDLPRVRLKTTKGDIVLELFKDEAPNAVGNFLTLVDKGFYKDVPFHRVLPYFMAQGGDPTGSGAGGPGYCIPCECRQDNARKHFRGSISMAHAGPDTGGSQFFLTFVPTFFLNNQHTVFGRVVEGMNVLSELQRIDPEGENLPAPDKILDAKIERGKPFAFKKLPSR